MVQDPLNFATEWCDAWNSHDLDRLMDHFHDDVVFTSPVAARILPQTGGVLRGKAALRDYWALGLDLIPDLRFEIERVFGGVSSIVIQYRNQKGVTVSEVLEFEEGLVRRGHGTYPPDAENPAGTR
jgi:ketosteroid isomerase-like protein